MRIRLDMRILKYAVCPTVVLALFLGGVLLLRAWEEGGARTPAEPTERSEWAEPQDERELAWYDGSWYAKREDLELTLVLGIDNYSEETGWIEGRVFTQSDFIMLLVIDRTNKQCTAVNVNRDTMAEYRLLTNAGVVAGTQTGQITLAHSYGGTEQLRCQNTVDAVSNLLYGVEIDHYISVTMDGVVVLNDLAGGVTLEIMDDLTMMDPSLLQGETVTLHGQQALTYIRSRMGLEDATNIRRMERQQQYLAALQTQLITRVSADSDFMLSALLELNSYMTSDCTVEQLSDLGETMEEYGGVGDSLTPEGQVVVNDDGHAEFHVDEEALLALVMDLFYERVEEG